MPIYRAAVRVLLSVVADIEGEAGATDYEYEEEAESVEMFKAQIQDRYLHDVDAEITFGPITEVRRGTQS